jgi:RHS repeat-associated protein
LALPLPAHSQTAHSQPASSQEAAEEHHYTYDAAENLLSRTVVRGGVPTEQTLPLDGSGRNRPASVAGVPLEWDANGNLTRKGDLSFACDFRNRLTEVRDAQGTVLASYTYDAFNRRVEQRIGIDILQTAWSGQRPIETSVNGTLRTRRTYGAGLDQVVRIEHDADGEGVLEQRYTPIYDSSGNLAVVTGTDGKPIERYSYSPYGGRRIFVDGTPPHLDQVRVVGDELWIEVSDVVNSAALRTAIDGGQLRLGAAVESFGLSLDRIEPHARRHRLELQVAASPAVGTALTLHVKPEAIVDLFHNPLADEVVVSFSWPAEDTVVFDAQVPEVHEVAYREGVLEVEFTEEVDLATAASSIQIAGYQPSWTKTDRGYRLVASEPLPAGAHELLITESLTDLAGTGLSQPFALELTVEPEAPFRVAYSKPDPRLTGESTLSNQLGFHGLSEDPVTGFLYARNRYYDPDLGRFISADPLGYVDGPNPYIYAMNSPVMYSDPLGLACPSCTALKVHGARTFATGPEPNLMPRLRASLDRASMATISGGWDEVGLMIELSRNLVPETDTQLSFEVGLAIGTAGMAEWAVPALRKVPLPRWMTQPVGRSVQKGPEVPWAPYVDEAVGRVQSKRLELGGADAVAMAEVPRGTGLADDALQHLTSSQQRSIRSLEKRIAEHQRKLDDFRANPTVRPGMEGLPDEVIKAQQAIRIRHLETEIQTFQSNIQKILNGEL